MTLKSRLLGNLIYFIITLLRKTLTVVVVNDIKYQPDQPFLFAFWHGKQLLPILELQRHKTKRAVLVSPSRDGDLLTAWLENLHYEVIRGSSRRGNIGALKAMIRFLKAGYSLGFGIDGPVGPIYKVKPGMTHMAQRCGIAIVPVGSAFSRRWVAQKAWDRYEIPKPFSKAVFYLGQPLYIAKDADLEASNQALEAAIQAAELNAQHLLI